MFPATAFLITNQTTMSPSNIAVSSPGVLKKYPQAEDSQ